MLYQACWVWCEWNLFNQSVEVTDRNLRTEIFGFLSTKILFRKMTSSIAAQRKYSHKEKNSFSIFAWIVHFLCLRRHNMAFYSKLNSESPQGHAYRVYLTSYLYRRFFASEEIFPDKLVPFSQRLQKFFKYLNRSVTKTTVQAYFYQIYFFRISVTNRVASSTVSVCWSFRWALDGDKYWPKRIRQEGVKFSETHKEFKQTKWCEHE